MRKQCNEGDPAKKEKAKALPEDAGCFGLSPVAGFGHHGEAFAPKKTLPKDVKEDREKEHRRYEGIGEGAVADVPEAVEDMHGHDPVIVKNEGDTELGKGPDEDDCAPGKEARAHKRQGDGKEALKAAAAEILSGLFHRRVDIGKRGYGIEVEDWVEAKGIEQDHTKEAPFAKPVNIYIFREDMYRVQKCVESTILA